MSNPENGTILAAIDGSQNSLVAAGVGARIARLLGVHLGLIYVLDVPALSFWVGVEARMKEDIRRQAESTLAEISQKISTICDVVPEFYIVEGMPEEEILKVVNSDRQILMVVAGRRGMASEKKSQLRLRRSSGHLGAKLSEILPVPVLLVPPDVPLSHICSAMAEFRMETPDSE